jgi:hypothetical protein
MAAVVHVSRRAVVERLVVAAVVPPQNPVERAIVDVFKLRIALTYPMLRLLYALLATARSSLKAQRMSNRRQRT